MTFADKLSQLLDKLDPNLSLAHVGSCCWTSREIGSSQKLQSPFLYLLV
jgi:hypothetical protein